MIAILHGTWLPASGSFFLWGEAATRAARRGRQPKLPAHPGQFTYNELHERLADLPSSTTIPPESEQTVWLPSAGGAPLPLREQRAAGAEVPEGPVTLAPWRVRGLLLPPGMAVEALLAFGAHRDAGSDLQSWRTATLLALELVAGQQFLPALARTGNSLRALWRPQPTPHTARKLAALARALPPLCRAVSADHAAAPPPRALLDSFLAAMVDERVRTLAAADPAVRAQLERWRRPGAPPGAAWLAALLGPNPALALTGRPAEELFGSWQRWSGQEHVAGDESFRITFRVEAPAEDQGRWALSYCFRRPTTPACSFLQRRSGASVASSSATSTAASTTRRSACCGVSASRHASARPSSAACTRRLPTRPS